MERLIEKLRSLNSILNQNPRMLANLFKEAEFKKGAILYNPTWETKPMLYFISSGLISGTTICDDDILLLWIMQTGFVIQNGMDQTIECLKDTKVFSLNLRKAEKQARKNVELYKVLLEIYQNCLMDGKKREVMLRIKNSTKRYTHFIENYPELYGIMTSDQTADFIGLARKYFYTVLKVKNLSEIV